MYTNSVLGPLEQEIMTCVWRQKTASGRDVHNCLASQKEIAYTTVMTVMTRLVEKNYLKRDLVGKQHIYTPKKRQATFMKGVFSSMATYLVDSFGEEALLAFVDEIDKQGISEKKKRELIEKLKNDNKE